MIRIATPLLLGLVISALLFVVLQIRQKRHKLPIPFTVDRHVSVAFSDSSAAAVIDTGVKILKHVDISASEDVSTDLPLFLSGSVGTFSYGDGTVSTPDDLDTLFKMKGAVHVVREIGCCGGEKNGILGCSGPEKPIIVTVESAQDASAVLWMHELGHNKGLCHRDRRFAIMNPVLIDTNSTVNQYEHDVFEGIIAPKPCPQEKISLTALSAIEFVHQIFIEGVPYEQGSQYKADDIPSLVELLDTPEEQRHWLNAITVLGMIGDSQALTPIKTAFERDSGVLSQHSYAAKLAVPLALGYLLSKSHNEVVFDYLNAGLKPTEWSKRVSWYESKYQTDAERNAHLTRLTIIGLGISGESKALTALQDLNAELSAMQATNLKNASLTGVSTAILSSRALDWNQFEPGTLAVLKAAIQTNQRVQKAGLVKYYRESELEQLGFNL